MKSIVFIVIIACSIILTKSEITYHEAIKLELDKNIKLWKSQKITSYEAEIEKDCLCKSEYKGPFNIKVDGTKIKSYDGAETICQGLLTVDGLFYSIQKAIDEKFEGLTVTYDNDLGYPKSLYFINKDNDDKINGIIFKLNAYEKANFRLYCLLPPKTGPCRGYFPRYYFDNGTEKCEEFIYGGCLGNPNNFDTIEECEATCSLKMFIS